MAELTLERLAELERLERKATAAPWRSMRDGNQYVNTSYIPTARCVGASRLDGVVRPWNPHALLAFGFKPEEYETARFLDADADLIAAMRNELPALLAAARRLLELESALEFLCDKHDGLLVYTSSDGDQSMHCTEAQAILNQAEYLRGIESGKGGDDV